MADTGEEVIMSQKEKMPQGKSIPKERSTVRGRIRRWVSFGIFSVSNNTRDFL